MSKKTVDDLITWLYDLRLYIRGDCLPVRDLDMALQTIKALERLRTLEEAMEKETK